jgi:hypothetical protein
MKPSAGAHADETTTTTTTTIAMTMAMTMAMTIESGHEVCEVRLIVHFHQRHGQWDQLSPPPPRLLLATLLATLKAAVALAFSAAVHTSAAVLALSLSLALEQAGLAVQTPWSRHSAPACSPHY